MRTWQAGTALCCMYSKIQVIYQATLRFSVIQHLRRKSFPLISHCTLTCTLACHLSLCLHTLDQCIRLFIVSIGQCVSLLHRSGVQYTLFQPWPESSLKITKRGKNTSLSLSLPLISSSFLLPEMTNNFFDLSHTKGGTERFVQWAAWFGGSFSVCWYKGNGNQMDKINTLSRH